MVLFFLRPIYLLEDLEPRATKHRSAVKEGAYSIRWDRISVSVAGDLAWISQKRRQGAEEGHTYAEITVCGVRSFRALPELPFAL